MLARTAFGEKGSAQSGPSTTVPPISAARGADDRADVAGVADPVQIDAGRLASAIAQRRGQTPIARVPEPSVETRAEQLRLDLRPAEARARLQSAARPARARPPRRRHQVLALAHEQILALAVLALLELADQLQPLVVGAGDCHRLR